MHADFEHFWQKHEGTFLGYANGEQIEELCKEIASIAWCESRTQTKVDYVQKAIALAETLIPSTPTRLW